MENIEKKVRMLSSLQWVTVLKNGNTISLNPRYKSIIKAYRNAHILYD